LNDSPVAKTLKIKANCTYVFDRAYNELAYWWKIVKAEAHLVSRLKKCSYSKWRRKEILKKCQGQDGVLWDGEWKPSDSVLRKAPQVPKDFVLRRIIFRDSETKKVFDFITSDFDCPAQEIADIYKKRWAVELLFRWLKGHLKIRYLEPRNPNAIKIQLTIAILVQLLVKLYQLQFRFKGTLWDCLRFLRIALAQRGIQSLKTLIFDPYRPKLALGADVRL